MRQLRVTAMGASMSGCGRYRFSLTRDWLSNIPTQPERKATVMWIGLNPSTADAATDDPTIRRMMAFSNDWGYRRMVVCNVFAFRATNPRDMITHAELIRHKDNFEHIGNHGHQAAKIICAWGGDPVVSSDDELLLLGSVPLITWCLGRTKGGAPLHPLYLAASTPLEPYGWASR